jgi:hypothetical protein
MHHYITKNTLAALIFMAALFPAFSISLRAESESVPDSYMVRVALNGRLSAPLVDRESILHDFAEIRNPDYLQLFSNEIPSSDILRTDFTILPQMYSRDGLYIKIRYFNQDNSMRDLESMDIVKFGQFKKIYYKINPTTEEADLSNYTGKFNELCMSQDYMIQLKKGYMRLEERITSQMKAGDYLVIVIQDSSDQIYSIAVKEGSYDWGLEKPRISFPVLTFTNVDAINKGESVILFDSIKVPTICLDVLRIQCPFFYRFGLGFSITASIDALSFLALNGTRFDATQKSVLSEMLPRSIILGALLNIELDSNSYYVGVGWNLREYWTNGFDFGVILGVKVFDLSTSFVPSGST